MKQANLGVLVAHGHMTGPHISWAELTPFIVLAAGALIVLLVGLLRSHVVRHQIVPALALLTLAGALGTDIWRFTHEATIVAGSLRVDHMAILVDMICEVAGIACVIMSWRAVAPREAGHGEYFALLLFSIFGMTILISAQDIITLFLGLEMLSIPLYVLCASEYRREGSLESGLKYLIIGSVGSATLAYGLAMVYGATGQTGFGKIATAILGHGLTGDPMLLTGVGLVLVGLAFKASVAPFHQWTPDVYEGAPTPITAFMATATKAAALAIFLRFFDVAGFGVHTTWAPAVAAVATITILVGNAGALPQTSMKRMLGYSGVAQAGYMLSGVVVATRLGVSSTVLYLGFYMVMNLAAFAVIQARERATGDDQLHNLAGLGAENPWLAWPLTIAMLGLAGIPGTVGFVGKFRLIDALVNGNYAWLAIILVIGSMISLGYYLRVVATIWMSSSARSAVEREMRLAPIAGGSPELDDDPIQDAGAPTSGRGSKQLELTVLAVFFAAVTVVFGIIPSVVFHLAGHAATLFGLR